MRVTNPTDMRKKLGEILDAASAGERILVERDHKPLAYLVSVEDGLRLEGREERLARSLAALDRLGALREQSARADAAANDGLTEAEWIHRERLRRMDPIGESTSDVRVGTDETDD